MALTLMVHAFAAEQAGMPMAVKGEAPPASDPEPSSIMVAQAGVDAPHPPFFFFQICNINR